LRQILLARLVVRTVLVHDGDERRRDRRVHGHSSACDHDEGAHEDEQRQPRAPASAIVGPCRIAPPLPDSHPPQPNPPPPLSPPPTPPPPCSPRCTGAPPHAPPSRSPQPQSCSLGCRPSMGRTAQRALISLNARSARPRRPGRGRGASARSRRRGSARSRERRT